VKRNNNMKNIIIITCCIIFVSCSKDTDSSYTIEGYLMEGFNAPNTPVKNQKLELELITNGPCDNKIDGASTFTNENGYFNINYTGSKCEGAINLISYTNNGIGIIDLSPGIGKNKNIAFDTLYNSFRSYSIIRYKDYKTLLDNDTVWIPAKGLGGNNTNKIIYGPFITDIFDTLTIYNNFGGGGIYFNVGIGNNKMKKLFGCPAGKINSYNMVDVK